MGKKQYGIYKGLKVEILGTKTIVWGKNFLDIKLPNGTIYACPPDQLKVS